VDLVIDGENGQQQTQSAAIFLDISPTHLDEEHAASKIIRPAEIKNQGSRSSTSDHDLDNSTMREIRSAEIKNKGSRSSTSDHDLDNSAMREIRPATMEDASHTKEPSILPHTPQENASLLHNEE
jgi:hypothetical protein